MQINILYFASLRDKTGKSQELINTKARTINELYDELSQRYEFNIDRNHLRVAKNEEYVPFETPLTHLDTIVFIPPVAGG